MIDASRGQCAIKLGTRARRGGGGSWLGATKGVRVMRQNKQSCCGSALDTLTILHLELPSSSGNRFQPHHI